MQSRLINIHKKLLKHFGRQHWWPGETPFEIMVGAILTQNTNWGNVERAINNLKQAQALNPQKMVESKASNVECWIKPSGYFRAKTKKLKIFCGWLLKNGGVPGVGGWGLGELRRELLGIWGIGPETADSILCYALGKKSFVVDAYTVRIFNRLGLIKTKDYHEIKKIFENDLPRNLKLYQEYHALIVALGKNYCKPKPACENCPVKSLCSD